MDIIISDRKLSKICNQQSKLVKKYGSRQAKLIRRRLDELSAAETLTTMRSLPQARCHELTGNRAGQLSVDLVHPERLIFIPAHNPVLSKPDGGLDWSGVTAIEILGIEDTHG